MRNTQLGMTLIELLIVVAVVGLLAALGTPFLLAAKTAANEASAVQSLRTLVSAQSTFANVCGAGSYTLSIPTLVSGNYASPDLDLSPKSGYQFALAPAAGSSSLGVDCTGAPSQSGYYFKAEPVSPSTGRFGYAVTNRGSIWQDTTGTAPTEPFTPSATVSPLQSQ